MNPRNSPKSTMEFVLVGDPCVCVQMQNRMDIIQLVLDTNALAYRNAGRMAMLAEQLGLSEQHAEVMLRQARAACRAGDLAVAHELALQLAVQQHPPAWQLVSEVILTTITCRAMRCDLEHSPALFLALLMLLMPEASLSGLLCL